MDKLSTLADKLNRTSFWIGNADSKAGYILGFNASMFGFLAWMYQAQDFLSCLQLLFAVMFLISFCYSTYKAFRVLMPDLDRRGAAQSKWFFADIAELGFDEYKEWMNTADEAAIENELYEQIHRTSRTAKNKFIFLKRSWIGLFSAMIFGVLTLILIIFGI